MVLPTEDGLKAGHVLANRYEIIEQIGDGGQGRVYLAFDRNVETKVAIKELGRLDPLQMRLFKRERDVLRGCYALLPLSVVDSGHDTKTLSQ